MITDERYFNLNEMKKSELITAWKDYVFPNRKRGGIFQKNPLVAICHNTAPKLGMMNILGEK